ncbi:MAG: hypothetical protein WC560_02895 [Syntrophales bacterium]
MVERSAVWLHSRFPEEKDGDAPRGGDGHGQGGQLETYPGGAGSSGKVS